MVLLNKPVTGIQKRIRKTVKKSCDTVHKVTQVAADVSTIVTDSLNSPKASFTDESDPLLSSKTRDEHLEEEEEEEVEEEVEEEEEEEEEGEEEGEEGEADGEEREQDYSNNYEKELTDTDDDQLVNLLPDIKKNPLDEIAVTAGLLGCLFGFGATGTVISGPYGIFVYVMALSLFHFLEFWVTAKYNPTRVHSESFIINNGPAYTIAHTFALLEAAIGIYLFPTWKFSFRLLQHIGFALMIMGQFTRTLAMKTAGKSFNHLVQRKRAHDHELVTNGIYFYLRHPSYFGFFWWAIGTQLLLLNPISLCGFALVLRKFFKERIDHEERFLVSFFGKGYEDYRIKTPVYIPFI